MRLIVLSAAVFLVVLPQAGAQFWAKGVKAASQAEQSPQVEQAPAPNRDAGGDQTDAPPDAGGPPAADEPQGVTPVPSTPAVDAP